MEKNMHIKTDGIIEKASKLSEGEVEFVVSTNALDAHGERINVDGIDIKDFKKNPVVLWGHDGFNLPIAKATKVWKENNKLMARAKFYLKDDFARKVYEYIVDGYLSAVSIGGMVQEWAEDGITISKLLMKEFSVVSIPANPEALATMKQLSDNQNMELKALANAYARKVLVEKTGKTDLVEKVELLENLVATLKELASSEPHDVKAESNVRRVVLKQAQVVDQQIETVIKTVKLKGNI
jgi:HK97 family phage prohead protease